jgi:hypothetical protein
MRHLDRSEAQWRDPRISLLSSNLLLSLYLHLATPQPVILSEGSRSLTARAEVEGPMNSTSPKPPEPFRPLTRISKIIYTLNTNPYTLPSKCP